MAQTQRGLAALRATGASLRLPYYLALLAEVCGHTDQATEGLTLVAEALAHVHTTGECWWAGSFSFRIGIVLRTPRSDKGLCSRWGFACLASPTYATTLSQGGVR